MKYIKKFNIFESLRIVDLKVGDKVHYQGSEYEVIEDGEYTVKLLSRDTKKEWIINQAQIDQYKIEKI